MRWNRHICIEDHIIEYIYIFMLSNLLALFIMRFMRIYIYMNEGGIGCRHLLGQIDICCLLSCLNIKKYIHIYIYIYIWMYLHEKQQQICKWPMKKKSERERGKKSWPLNIYAIENRLLFLLLISKRKFFSHQGMYLKQKKKRRQKLMLFPRCRSTKRQHMDKVISKI